MDHAELKCRIFKFEHNALSPQIWTSRIRKPQKNELNFGPEKIQIAVIFS